MDVEDAFEAFILEKILMPFHFRVYANRFDFVFEKNLLFSFYILSSEIVSLTYKSYFHII